MLLGRIAFRWQAMKLVMAWNGWLDAVANAKRQRNLLARVLARFRHSTLAKAFLAWLDMTARARTARGMLNRAALRMRSSVLAAAFDRWVEAAAHMRHMRAVQVRLSWLCHTSCCGTCWMVFAGDRTGVNYTYSLDVLNKESSL